jgi:hypothetical protein
MDIRRRSGSLGAVGRDSSRGSSVESRRSSASSRERSRDAVRALLSAARSRAHSDDDKRASDRWVLRAKAFAVTLLRPDVALEVGRLLEHDPADLNVSRHALSNGISRWTLRRRLAHTGVCPKQLVALARIFAVLGSFSPRGAGTRGGGRLTERTLLRGERRTVREWLGHTTASLANLWAAGGLLAVHDTISRRFPALVVATDPRDSKAARQPPPRRSRVRLDRAENRWCILEPRKA